MSYVYKLREEFKRKYLLNDIAWQDLWYLFLEYGMTGGEAPHRSRANHYFLQGVCEHLEIEWHSWKSKMTKDLKEIIEQQYPQLMVTDKSLSKNNIDNQQ